MPQHPRQRGDVAIAIHVGFRLLPYEVEITAEDDRLTSKLGYLANGALQDVALEGRMQFEVTGHGPYVITEDGAALGPVGTPDDVLYVLYGQCYGRLVRHLTVSGWVPVHGGLVTIFGQRLLMVGEKGAGKTTLMLRLLHDGHDVEGDELAFTRSGVAVAMPRPFHLKPGADALIPELAGSLDGLPHTTGHGIRITAFDPSVAGFRWTLRMAPVDGAVVLRANHGGATSARPLTTVDLVQYVVAHAFLGSESRTELLGALAALLGDRDGIELQVGDVTEGAHELLTFATLPRS